MNFADSDRSGSSTRRTLGDLAPTAKRLGQVERLPPGLDDRYGEFSPRNRFERPVYLRVCAQLR